MFDFVNVANQNPDLKTLTSTVRFCAHGDLVIHHLRVDVGLNVRNEGNFHVLHVKGRNSLTQVP